MRICKKKACHTKQKEMAQMNEAENEMSMAWKRTFGKNIKSYHNQREKLNNICENQLDLRTPVYTDFDPY